jgi:16S rRNA processing protein RimM
VHERLAVALVRGLHGVHGAMRVEVLTDRPDDRFVVGARLFPEGSTGPLTIVEARPANPGWVLRFREVPTRQAAEAFRLVYLEVETGPADALPAEAFFWHEMVGAAVREPGGAALGVVRDVYRTGGADVLEVVGGPRGDFDLPLARPFTLVLDPRGVGIVADPDALDLPDQAPLPRPVRPPRPRRATRRRPAVPQAPPRRAADMDPASGADAPASSTDAGQAGADLPAPSRDAAAAANADAPERGADAPELLPGER